jgi:hypothetical protein
MVFESTWWSAELPEGWLGSAEEDCATFFSQSDGAAGAIQVSSTRKTIGDVTYAELREFATKRLPAEAHLEPFLSTELSGYTAIFCEEQTAWQMWWIARGSVLIYVTYNVEVDSESTAERGCVSTIVESLRVKI